MNKLRGLTAYVYKNALIGDCTNGGTSSKVDKITIVNAEGPSEADESAPAFVVITRNIGGEIYKHLQPANDEGKPLPGWFMFGGNYAETSDSRFPNRYPLAIHDRQEHS